MTATTLLTGVQLIDGTGGAPREADVLLTGDTITAGGCGWAAGSWSTEAAISAGGTDGGSPRADDRRRRRVFAMLFVVLNLRV